MADNSDRDLRGEVEGGASKVSPWWVIGVVVILIAGVTTLFLVRGGADPSKSVVDNSTPTDSVTLPPPDGGIDNISVVEQGFSSIEAAGKISFGAIVENASDRIAQDTHGELIPTDENGGPLVDEPIEVMVYSIMPEDRMALSHDIEAGDLDNANLDDVDDIQIEMVETEMWRNVDRMIDSAAAPPLASEIEFEPRDNGKTYVAFMVGEERDGMHGGIYVVNGIFRNQQDEIIGSCYVEDESIIGKQDTALSPCYLPDEIVESETEIHSDLMLSELDGLAGNNTEGP